MGNELITAAREATKRIKAKTGETVAAEGFADGKWRLLGHCADDVFFDSPPEWESRVEAVRLVQFDRHRPSRFPSIECRDASRVASIEDDIMLADRDSWETPLRGNHRTVVTISINGWAVPPEFGKVILKIDPEKFDDPFRGVGVARHREEDGSMAWFAYDYARGKGEKAGLTPDGEWIVADGLDDVREQWLKTTNQPRLSRWAVEHLIVEAHTKAAESGDDLDPWYYVVATPHGSCWIVRGSRDPGKFDENGYAVLWSAYAPAVRETVDEITSRDIAERSAWIAENVPSLKDDLKAIGVKLIDD